MHEIKAYLFDICGDVEVRDMKQFQDVFPCLKLKEISGSSCEIELLVGNNCATLHRIPRKVFCSTKLAVVLVQKVLEAKKVCCLLPLDIAQA